MHKGIFIIAHKPLASAFSSVVKGIYGEIKDFEAVDIASDDPKERKLEQLKAAWSRLNTEEAVVLTDLCGATPSNVSSEYCHGKKVLCIDPLSLPLLMKMITYREETLDVLLEKAKEVYIHKHEDENCHCHGSE